MAPNGEEVVIHNSVRTFRRVVGGELPLSEEAAALWLDGDESDVTAVRALCGAYSGNPDAARWLRYGRSALGLALDLCGIRPTDIVAIAPYQCPAVINKVASRSRHPHTYPLDGRLVPDPRGLLEQGSTAKAVITCVYFGSETIESKLGELGKALLAMPQNPWVIEDRVMCFPDPGRVSLAKGRCDFALVGFRKHYPVPDGALLIACSDRAREALFHCSGKVSSGGADRDSAIRQKILAKVKRHAWLSSLPLVDDAELSGLKESVSSEAILNMVADSPDTDSWPGTAASASYILGRDLARDAREVRARSRIIVDELRRARGAGVTLNLRDCGGIGVPLLVGRRDAFKTKAAETGIFLPVHWPRPDGVQVSGSIRLWYEQEVTVPVIAGGPTEDVTFLIDALTQIGREVGTCRDIR